MAFHGEFFYLFQNEDIHIVHVRKSSLFSTKRHVTVKMFSGSSVLLMCSSCCPLTAFGNLMFANYRQIYM